MSKSKEIQTAEVIEHDVIQAAPASVDTIHPGKMIAVLMDRPDIPIDKLTALFELQLRYDEEIARKAFLAAKARFSEIAPTIIRDGVADFTVSGKRTHYQFATLAGAMDQIREALADCGLNVSWKTQQEGAAITVTCFLTHELGHQEETSLTAGAQDGKGNTGMNSLQALKSTTSYLKRITLFSLAGLADRDEDDDGVAGGENAKPPKLISEEQIADLRLFMEQVRLPEDAMLQHFKLGSLEEMPVAMHALAISMLKNRERKMAEEGAA